MSLEAGGQPMIELASATELLRKDHRQIEELLDRLLLLAKHPSRNMAPSVAQITAELRQLADSHFAREEGVLYPYLRSLWPDLLAQMDEQHAYVREVDTHLNELLSELSGAPTERQYSELVRFSIELHDTTQHHIVAEEDHLLRLADSRLSANEQRTLAARMRTDTAD